jgi:hypothetical protein
VSNIIPVILSLLQQLLPALSNSKTIQTIVSTLIALVPVIIQEYKDLLPIVKNIISALQGKDEITPEQMIELKALNKLVDDEFEAALAARIAATQPQ